MKVLHIFRSKPDGETLKLVKILSRGNRWQTTHLPRETVDYNELVKRVFDADKVISWW